MTKDEGKNDMTKDEGKNEMTKDEGKNDMTKDEGNRGGNSGWPSDIFRAIPGIGHASLFLCSQFVFWDGMFTQLQTYCA